MSDRFVVEALRLLRKLTRDQAADFRPGQLEAIRALIERRQRVLLVQRTGWGKSAVYFIATRLLRGNGAGPTLLISPLLALMRNQIEAAGRLGVKAETINSSNREEWKKVERRLQSDAVDILLISPERLANPHFRSEILPGIARRSGLLVIDEAHCISDWGHDFRPDYRRISRVLAFLVGVPVLCCTATANDRVIEDVSVQLGSELTLLRGPLTRAGLRLHVLQIPSQARRLTWLASALPRMEGTGVVYCLTIADTQRVAGWLESVGIRAIAYWGGLDSSNRVEVEQALLSNRVKVVVATSALGMGFDKPDLSFVVHYQSPGSPITYYQQVGRAGRALNQSWGVLLCGREDSDIQDYFIHGAFPPADLAEQVVALLAKRTEPMTRGGLLRSTNVRDGQLTSLLKNLEVDGAIERAGSGWRRTLKPWSFDRRRVHLVTGQRRKEQEQMLHYAQTEDCRMQLLASYLDDVLAGPCGICDNCTGRTLAARYDPGVVQQAVGHLRGLDLVIDPRKQLPDRTRIQPELGLERGRALSVWGDGGWGSLVRTGKQVDRRFDDQLVDAAVHLIRDRWRPDRSLAWVTSVPSLRDPGLVSGFAARLAVSLGLPYLNVVEKVRETEPQKLMQNSQRQYRNVHGAFSIRGTVPNGPVLLVDDIVDSKWTLTVVGGQLRLAGAGSVYPFALADTSGRSAG